MEKTISQDQKSLYENNATRLVKYFISRHRNEVIYFDSYDDYEQELLLAIWKALPLFNSDKGTFSTYVFTCCRNFLFIKIRQSKTSKRDGVTISLDEEIGDGITLKDSIESSDKSIEDCISEEEIMRKIINLLCYESKLYFIEQISQTEIAKKLGVTKSEISRRIGKNIRKVKRVILRGEDPNKQTCREIACMNGISIRTYFRRKAKEKKNGE